MKIEKGILHEKFDLKGFQDCLNGDFPSSEIIKLVNLRNQYHNDLMFKPVTSVSNNNINEMHIEEGNLESNINNAYGFNESGKNNNSKKLSDNNITTSNISPNVNKHRNNHHSEKQLRKNGKSSFNRKESKK